MSLESLESRLLLDGEGITWQSAAELTVSFAPDGTDIAGYASSLYAKLDELPPTESWQEAVLRAFATWTQHTNASITVVPDGGQPFGVPGPTQGDPRFGDIRIGALPLSADVIAMSVPQNEVVSGTWAGDVLFNANAELDTIDEFFAVALHEAGHVLGLGHSDDPSSPMYVHGIPTSLTPTDRDIAKLQSLYGLRIEPQQNDENGEGRRRDEDGHEEDHREDEAARRNDVLMENVDALLVSPGLKPTRYETSALIDSPDDADYFELQASGLDIEDMEYLSIIIRSEDPHGSTPRVTVFDHEGAELRTRVLANGDGLLVLQADDADPSASHVVKIAAADADEPFQSASYQVIAEFAARKVTLNKLASGELDKERSSSNKTLHVSHTELVHWALAPKAADERTPVLMRAVLYDEAGMPVDEVAAAPGETRSAHTTLLQPGDYRIEVYLERTGGGELPEVEYDLLGDSVTLPIGPALLDPTEAPLLACSDPGADHSYCRPADVMATDPVILPGPLQWPLDPNGSNPTTSNPTTSNPGASNPNATDSAASDPSLWLVLDWRRWQRRLARRQLAAATSRD